MNYCFCSDFHINSPNLEELYKIFEELLSIISKTQISKVIIAGDSFDKINPNSIELDCLANFLKVIPCPTVLLAASSHESSTPEESVINHFGILKDDITVCKEYIEDPLLFVGHFGITQSSLSYGGTVDKTTLSKYRNVVLGHFHNFEIIHPNICQLGSVRFVDFGEDTSIAKRIAICYDFEKDKPKWHFPLLSSTIPIVNVTLSKTDASVAITSSDIVQPVKPSEQIKHKFETIPSLCTYLDSLSEFTKVRVIFEDYNNWRSFLPLSTKYKSRFTLYKEKRDFIINLADSKAKSENTTLKDSLIKYLEINKVPEEIKLVLLEEIK